MNILRKSLTIAAVAAAGVTIVWLGVEKFAGGVLERQFAKATGGRYTLTTGRVNLDVFRGTVTLSDLVFTGNPSPTPAAARKKSSRQIRFSARELVVAGLKTDSNRIDIDRIKLTRPWLGRGKVLRIALDRIVLSERADNIDTLQNLVRGLRFEGGRLDILKISHMPADGSTLMELDSLHIDTASRSLTLARAAITPTYPKQEFARKSWAHKDWTSLTVSDLSCGGIDFVRLLHGGGLHVDSVSIRGGALESYKDRNVMRTEWVKPMYHTMIQSLKLPLDVGLIAFSDIDIRYEELPIESTVAGGITITDISGEALGFSNLPDSEGVATYTASARIMGSAPLSVVGRLPVRAGNDNFELEGVLGKCDLSIFSPISTPLGGVELTGGHIRSLDFSIAGTSEKARCVMVFLYDDLAIELIGDHGRGKDHRGLSNLLNRRILLTANPLRGNIRRSSGEFTRDPLRSPWNFIWKTMFAALTDAVGVGALL